jgi:hypothetical protein
MDKPGHPQMKAMPFDQCRATGLVLFGRYDPIPGCRKTNCELKQDIIEDWKEKKAAPFREQPVG